MGNTPEQIKKLDCIQMVIQMVIQRVRQTGVITREEPFISKDDPITTVSEKMIKGKAIDSVVKCGSCAIHA